MRKVLYLFVALAVVVTLACGGGGGGGGISTDTTPPTISGLGVSPILLTNTATAQITSTVVDLDSGVATVQAVLTYPDNRQANVSLARVDTTNTYQATFTAQWNGTAGDLRVQLRAVDRAGNQATQETQVRLAGNPPPPPF
ncbi:MAG: hypothetical protein SNJ72_01415 [Fimbriimonadales bacterium]